MLSLPSALILCSDTLGNSPLAAALFGVGAYTTALIVHHFPGAHLLFALLAIALSGFVAAALIGFFCVRLSGAYFSLTTLAFQMFLYAVALKWRSLTNGDDGMGIIRPELHLPVGEHLL